MADGKKKNIDTRMYESANNVIKMLLEHIDGIRTVTDDTLESMRNIYYGNEAEKIK